MRIAILYNLDHDLLEHDPGREAREDVQRVATSVRDALLAAGHDVRLVAVCDATFSFAADLDRDRPDVVFNLCESIAADARGELAVPAVLDVLGLPYTGSPSLALGLALHKPKAKELLRARGVPTPESCLVESTDQLADVHLAFPLIVKPSREDASTCIEFDSVVWDRAALGKAVRRVLNTLSQPALVERYVDGREIYVPLLGNQARIALPLSEVHFGRAFEGRPRIVSYAAKWHAQSPECIDSPTGPALLDEATQARVVRVARTAFDALGCRDYGRVDLRLSSEGEPFVIDVNPNCDLHPDAGFAKAARAAGLEYPALALRLVELALERANDDPTHRTRAPGAAREAAGGHRHLHAGRGDLRARADRPGARAQPSGLQGARGGAGRPRGRLRVLRSDPDD